MSALPNSTMDSPFLAGLDTGVFLSPGERGWTEIVQAHQQLKTEVTGAAATRLRFGLMLVEMRKRIKPGMWLRSVEGYGIHRNTATRSLKVAGVQLGLSRVQMAEVMQCPVEKLTNYPPKKWQKSGVCTTVVQTDRVSVRVPEDFEAEDGSEGWAFEEEMAAIPDEGKLAVMVRDMVPVGGKREQGSAKVDTLEVGAGGAGGQQPPAFAEQTREVPRLRLVDAELGRARVTDVEGQMTLVGNFLDGINSRKARLERLDGERRLAAEAVLAECGRKLDEILGEAA